MCIAIAKPADKQVSIETLGRCFTANPDGAGFAYSNGSDMVIVKGLMTMDEFKTKYEEHGISNKKALIHFRITTRGTNGPENTHPFPLKGGALIHNGTISELGKSGEGKSDTALFAEMIHDMDIDSLNKMRPMIERFVSGSRVAAMYANGELLVFNERSWTVDDGVLYSNTSYKPSPVYHGASAFVGASGFGGAGYVGSGLVDDEGDEYLMGWRETRRSSASKDSNNVSRLPHMSRGNAHATVPTDKPVIVVGTHRDNKEFRLRYEPGKGFDIGYTMERTKGSYRMIWLPVNLMLPAAMRILGMMRPMMDQAAKNGIRMRAMYAARTAMSDYTQEEALSTIRSMSTHLPAVAAATVAQPASAVAAGA